MSSGTARWSLRAGKCPFLWTARIWFIYICKQAFFKHRNTIPGRWTSSISFLRIEPLWWSSSLYSLLWSMQLLVRIFIIFSKHWDRIGEAYCPSNGLIFFVVIFPFNMFSDWTDTTLGWRLAWRTISFFGIIFLAWKFWYSIAERVDWQWPEFRAQLLIL